MTFNIVGRLQKWDFFDVFDVIEKSEYCQKFHRSTREILAVIIFEQCLYFDTWVTLEIYEEHVDQALSELAHDFAR